MESTNRLAFTSERSEIVTDTSVKQALEEGEEKRDTGKVVGVVAARLYKMDKHQTETQSKKPGVCETVIFSKF